MLSKLLNLGPDYSHACDQGCDFLGAPLSTHSPRTVFDYEVGCDFLGGPLPFTGPPNPNDVAGTVQEVPKQTARSQLQQKQVPCSSHQQSHAAHEDLDMDWQRTPYSAVVACVSGFLSWMSHNLSRSSRPRPTVDHCFLHATPVGEATNPGPHKGNAPGAMQFDIGSILGADFTSMLQALIQQQVQAAVQAVTEAPPRKRRKGKGKGATNPTAPTQEFVDQSPTGPAKGSKGKGNSSSPQSGDNGLNGRGQQPLCRQQHPAKGSGRSTSTPEDSEGWTKIQRKKDREADTSFELRQQDWNAPVISFASLAKKLDDTKAGEVCKGVIMCTHHEVQVAQSLFAGTSKAHALLLIVPCRDFPKDADKPTAPKEKIPGKVGLMLRSVDAYAYRVWSHGQSAPQPIGISTAPATITPKATTVLFVKVPQAFAPSAVWKGFIERPQKQMALWTAQHHVLCIDCFAFAEEQLKGGHKQVYGVIRVAVADSSTLLAAPGEQGIFVQVPKEKLKPSKWNGFPDSPKPNPMPII